MQRNKPYNDNAVSILLTGGAGFIGSHILDALVSNPRVMKITILDNFSTGHKKNIIHNLNKSNVRLIDGDIRDIDTCREACEGANLVCHQAALGSVPRSLADPLTSHGVNVTGTLNVFQAAVEKGVKRVVFAASSSTYGDSAALPKKEDIIGKPLSPYAVTKLVNEIYAEVYARCYDIEYIGLRYFNVFGPRQDPFGPYAAVIPLFMKAARENKSPVINGDGMHSRDFTYVANAVEANILALFADNAPQEDHPSSVNQIYNVACGQQSSLNQLWQMIRAVSGCSSDAVYRPERPGDVTHSLADISKIGKCLGYFPKVAIREGLHATWQSFEGE